MCAILSHSWTLRQWWQATGVLPRHTLLLLAVSRALFAGPGSADIIYCSPARGQPLDLSVCNYRDGSKVAWRWVGVGEHGWEKKGGGE